ncbi:MAG: UDP-3-O-acyl-N-acetylglucosamine deacetylase [Chlamydiia bacterium]
MPAPHSRPQTTVKRSLSWHGIGVHTGRTIALHLHPMEAHHGIQFVRTDIIGASPIRAHWSNVQDATRNNTTLGVQGTTISTVEHLLSALTALGVDNCLIEVDGPELPILDGSALPYAESIRDHGLQTLSAEKIVHNLERPVWWSEGQIQLVALPSDHYQVSYTLHYPQHALLQAQFHHYVVDSATFKSEIAPCRTFALAEELEVLRRRGLIRGGSLENAVVIQGDTILNPEGLRLPQEMVRHKILDMIGDLTLVGESFNAHIIAIRSGHASNVALARRLSEALEAATITGAS